MTWCLLSFLIFFEANSLHSKGNHNPDHNLLGVELYGFGYMRYRNSDWNDTKVMYKSFKGDFHNVRVGYIDGYKNFNLFVLPSINLSFDNIVIDIGFVPAINEDLNVNVLIITKSVRF